MSASTHYDTPVEDTSLPTSASYDDQHTMQSATAAAVALSSSSSVVPVLAYDQPISIITPISLFTPATDVDSQKDNPPVLIPQGSVRPTLMHYHIILY
jgi:hypothetical protein